MSEKESEKEQLIYLLRRFVQAQEKQAIQLEQLQKAVNKLSESQSELALTSKGTYEILREQSEITKQDREEYRNQQKEQRFQTRTPGQRHNA